MSQAKDIGEESTSAQRWAYLVSQYPAVSHTFILREIRELRKAGLSIQVASIRDADRPLEKLSREEGEELRQTVYIRAQRPRWLSLHLRTFFCRPVAYVSTLLYAVLQAHGDLWQILRHLSFFAEAVVVGQWMISTGAVCLHTHFASTVALFASRMFGFPFSATVHGSDEFIDVAAFLMREKVRAADLIITISNYGRSQVLRSSDSRDWHKVQVVRLGVDTAQYQPSPRTSASGIFEVISVGRLASPKAQEILIRACAELMGEGRRLRLRIVGDGPDRDYLTTLARSLCAEEDVIFEGALSHDRVLELYRGADAFALTSFAEGVPVVLMEAMALQIPCAATRITGVPELIRDEEEGLLAAPSSISEFSTCLRRLMDDVDLRDRLAKSGRKKVVSEYDLTTNVTTLFRLFRATTEGTNHRSQSASARTLGS